MELKPCPFCGGEAFKRTTKENIGFLDNQGNHFSDFVVYHVTCKSCGADIRSPETAPEYCEALWNRRAADEDIAAAQREKSLYKAAIKKSDALIAKIDAFLQEGNWISVKDRLPEDRGDVLVVVFWHENWQVKMAWCVPERKEWSVHIGFADRNDVQVSYWQPLPKPPKEG